MDMPSSTLLVSQERKLKEKETEENKVEIKEGEEGRRAGYYERKRDKNKET
jgi:hypothetical protein